jgi:hypothetical protein
MTNYNCAKEHIFLKLEEYMFSSKNIASLTKLNYVDKLSKHTHNFKQKDTTIFTPHNKDKIFWSMFILINGLESYEILNKNEYFKVETKTKIDYVEKLREMKSILKEKKLRRSLIEADILNEKISFISLEAICVIHNVSVILVKNNNYIEINKGSKFIGALIYENGILSIKISNIDNYVESIKNKYYEITSITKPIRAISAYMLADLYKICQQLKIELKNDARKKTKQEIYNEIKNMLLSDEI